MPTVRDRRVRRTRDLLHRSLMALILEKGYGRVTVQDILDRADVGRSTFYTHYQNKDDLLVESGQEYLWTMFGEHAPASPNIRGGPTPLLHPAWVIFRLADGNRPLYQALVGKRGSDLVARSANKMLTEVFTEHLRAQRALKDDSHLEVVVAFLVSGLIGMLTWWLNSEAPFTADEIYACFEGMAIRGIEPLLDRTHLSESRRRSSRGATTPV